MSTKLFQCVMRKGILRILAALREDQQEALKAISRSAEV
jgi:hypothetical protein